MPQVGVTGPGFGVNVGGHVIEDEHD